MMRFTRLAMSLAYATLLCAFASEISTAQDPVTTNPGKYQVLFENERVRVLEYRDKPGDKAVMHSHPDYLVYAFGPFERKFTYPDGKSAEVQGKAGQVIWRPAEKHAGENTGTTNTHVLIIELKEQPKGVSAAWSPDGSRLREAPRHSSMPF